MYRGVKVFVTIDELYSLTPKLRWYLFESVFFCADVTPLSFWKVPTYFDYLFIMMWLFNKTFFCYMFLGLFWFLGLDLDLSWFVVVTIDSFLCPMFTCSIWLYYSRWWMMCLKSGSVVVSLVISLGLSSQMSNVFLRVSVASDFCIFRSLSLERMSSTKDSNYTPYF